MQIKAFGTKDPAGLALAGDWLFSSPFTAAGSFETQTDTALAAMKTAASDSGFEPSGYVKCDVLLKDLANRETVIAAYRRVIGEELPAFRFIEEKHLPNDALIALELVAVRGESAKNIRRCRFEGEELPCVVRAGDYAFTALMLPTVHGSLVEEAASAIARLKEAVALVGGSEENFVKNFVHLLDCGNFNAFNEVYAETFMHVAQPPARSLHGVSKLEDDAVAAVEGIAYFGDRKETVKLGEESEALPFCKAMRAGQLLFVSGQVGVMSPGGGYNLLLKAQIPCMLEILDAIAAAGGILPKDYVKVTTFARKLKSDEAYTKAFAARYPDTPTALSFYEVTGLAHPAIQIESDIVGYYS